MNREHVFRFIEEAIQENESLFLVKATFLKKKILVVIDGDSSVPIKEYARISRYLLNSLAGVCLRRSLPGGKVSYR